MSNKYSTWTCRECGNEYVPADKKYGGYIYLCDTCSFETQFEDGEIVKKVGRVDRYVGRMTEKGNEGIIIFRSDIASHKAQLILESRRGMSPNLNITSPVNQLVRDQDLEQKELDGEVKDTKREKKKEVPMKKEELRESVKLTEEEMDVLISQMCRRCEKLEESGDYPEKKRDRSLIDRLLDAKLVLHKRKRDIEKKGGTDGD